MQKVKRALALLLCVVMVLGVMPMSVFADEAAEGSTIQNETVEGSTADNEVVEETEEVSETSETEEESDSSNIIVEESSTSEAAEKSMSSEIEDDTVIEDVEEESSTSDVVEEKEKVEDEYAINSIGILSEGQTVAEEGNDFPEYPNEGAIRIDKTASAVGTFSQTGIAKMELSMTGVPYATGSEIDVVLVLDASDSMYDEGKGTRVAAAREAAYELIQQICVNKDGTFNNNRVAIVYFGSSDNAAYPVSGLTTDLKQYKYSTDYGFALDSLSSLDSIRSVIYDNYPKLGSTNYSNGLAIADAILSNARSESGYDRQQFCVFMSDGKPTGVRQVKTFDDNGKPTSWRDGDYTLSTSNGNQLYEYYSSMMKYEGVHMYCVGTAMAQDADTNVYTLMQNMASSAEDLYYVSQEDVVNGVLKEAFGDIALKIQQAATDVTVEDQIDDKYTMIFDIPTGTKTISGASDDLYIEFVKYTLDENNERKGNPAIITKLYLAQKNDRYVAASDNNGTAYAESVFETKTLGDKGTKYYWTTDATKSTDDILVNGYYFTKNGDGTHNMTSGAWADGSVVNNMSNDLILATPYFVYNANTRMLYWTVDKLDTNEYALRYFLYLNNSATHIGEENVLPAGTYPTNDHAKISYTNHLKRNVSKDFPVPRMTWNGAQVSYVFYLVNGDGQPINSAGQVIDFANAVFVTDIFTKNVTWNDPSTPHKDGVAYLDADYEAGNLLPEGYTLYDAGAKYELDVYEDSEGSNLGSQFIIGATAGIANNTTTKVYNTKAGTKISEPGTYTKENAGDIDFANTTVAFAVVWSAKLVEDVVVVDFGLDTLINVTRNDLVTSTISGIGNEADVADYGKEMNIGLRTEKKLDITDEVINDHTFSIEDKDTIRFHQGNMKFEEPTVCYYESPVTYYGENNAKLTGYMYSSVTVIPATTIYYEDEYATLKTYTKKDDGSYLEEAGWIVNSEHVTAVQDQDRPGENKISETLDADNNYGYDSAYKECSKHSMGSAAMVNVYAGKYATAEFEFYGDGFDVISLTDKSTGTIYVDVYDKEGNKVISDSVNTYYGYKRTDNGDGTYTWETTTNDDPNALYQVPVIKETMDEYGYYKVVITVSYAGFLDSNKNDTGYNFYLDAIRIYNPTGNESNVAVDAYFKDGEAFPKYYELRDYVIEKNTLDGLNSESVSGIVFIDGANANGADNTAVIKDYVSYGPNNELYLEPGQAVAFVLNEEVAIETNDIASVQIAIKTVGEEGSVKVYGVDGENKTTECLNETIKTATDMYYDITELNGKTVVVLNNGASDDAIISVTNVKVTYKLAENGTEDQRYNLFTVSRSAADAALMSLSLDEDTSKPEVEDSQPDNSEPEVEESKPEISQPEEEEESKPEIQIPEKVTDRIKNVINKITNAFNKLFGKWFR